MDEISWYVFNIQVRFAPGMAHLKPGEVHVALSAA